MLPARRCTASLCRLVSNTNLICPCRKKENVRSATVAAAHVRIAPLSQPRSHNIKHYLEMQSNQFESVEYRPASARDLDVYRKMTYRRTRYLTVLVNLSCFQYALIVAKW